VNAPGEGAGTFAIAQSVIVHEKARAAIPRGAGAIGRIVEIDEWPHRLYRVNFSPPGRPPLLAWFRGDELLPAAASR
jgi:hypothetical protein